MTYVPSKSEWTWKLVKCPGHLGQQDSPISTCPPQPRLPSSFLRLHKLQGLKGLLASPGVSCLSSSALEHFLVSPLNQMGQLRKPIITTLYQEAFLTSSTRQASLPQSPLSFPLPCHKHKKCPLPWVQKTPAPKLGPKSPLSCYLLRGPTQSHSTWEAEVC